ncbi:MAG: hypothetical protein PHH08_03430 [Candidatus ainarchaeum sp.]|nr:hypothetical protein [Candidatus ainarchaeum sp.]
MKKLVFGFLLAVSFVLLAGCTQSGVPPSGSGAVPGCAQVVTYAVDSAGKCSGFPTSCIPEGYTKVAACSHPCERVACEDKCDGTARLSEGMCELENNTPKCVYSKSEAGSPLCVQQKFGLETEAVLRYCNYSKSFESYTFFLSVKNLGASSPKVGSSVWLVGSDINSKIYQPINNTYEKGIFWWQEVFSDKPYRGQTFELSNRKEFRKLDYKFVYCELANNNTDVCNESNGLVLYSGDTNKDCNVIG